jgi:RNA polymerase sigma factor (sigma-70 family)
LISRKQFARYSQHLKRVLRSRGRSDTDAEDLIQDAFLRLHIYSSEHDVREPEAFLVRAATNLSIDRYRHDAILDFTDHELEDLHLLDQTPGPEEVCASRERLGNLVAGMERLDSKTREIFALQRFEGRAYADIAKMHNMTVSAVEKHVAKAVLFLMEWIDDDQ